MAADDWEVPQDDWAVPGGTAPATPSKASGLWNEIKSIPGGVVSGLASAASALGKAEAPTSGIDPNEIPDAQTTAGMLEKHVTGELPKTGAYGRTVGEFLGNPVSYVGPGGFLPKAAMNVVSGLGSEAAGQAAEGTGLEGAARMAGAMGAGSALSRATATAAIKPQIPTVEQLKNAARDAYNHPAVEAIKIKPTVTVKLADDIVDSLNGEGFRKLNAPQTYGIVDELKTPVGPASTIADLNSVRKALNRAYGSSFNNPTEQAAATHAIGEIDDYLAKLRQTDLIAGHAPNAAKILNDAKSNWGAAKRAEKLEEKLDAADLQSASTYSGGNLDNATRQKLKSILVSPKLKRGYSADELEQMEQIVRGSVVGNISRKVGKILGGGGGLGTMLTAGAGYGATGHPAGMMLPLVGMAARKIGSNTTVNSAKALDEAIRSRSREAEQWAAISKRIANMKGRSAPLSYKFPATGELLHDDEEQ